MNVSLLIIFLFLVFALYLGVKARSGKQMNMEEWAVGGRSFGTLFIFLLIAGEVYTTFTFLGGSGWAYSKGSAAYYVMTYITLGYVFAYWLSPKIWSYATRNKLISQGDFFESKYNSPYLGVLVSIVGAVALVPYIVLQFKGLGIIVSQASYQTISPTVASCIGALVVTIYVLISGIHGSAWTAVVKDFLILVVVIFLGIYLPFHYFGGIGPMFEAVHKSSPQMLTLADEGLSVSWFISTVLITSMGFYILPTTFSVVLTAKGEKQLRKNTMSLSLYTLLLLFVFFVGFTAMVQIPGLQGPDGDLSLLKLSVETFDPWFVGIIGAAGLLTALVPASVMLTSASTGLARNLYKVFVPTATDRQVSAASKLFLILLSGLSLYFAITGGEALALLNLMSYSLVIQIAPSLFLSFMKNNFVTKYGAFAGIVAGEIMVIYINMTGTTMSTLMPSAPQVIKDINTGFVAVLVNIIVMSIVSIVTNRAVVNNKKVNQVEI
jgi:solute:Na+ symporter, SSS family